MTPDGKDVVAVLDTDKTLGDLGCFGACRLRLSLHPGVDAPLEFIWLEVRNKEGPYVGFVKFRVASCTSLRDLRDSI